MKFSELHKNQKYAKSVFNDMISDTKQSDALFRDYQYTDRFIL